MIFFSIFTWQTSRKYIRFTKITYNKNVFNYDSIFWRTVSSYQGFTANHGVMISFPKLFPELYVHI